MNSTDYDSATYTSVAQLISDNDNNKIASDLKVGDVVAFKTASGKYGILKVKAISSNSDTGTITIDYKIQ